MMVILDTIHQDAELQKLGSIHGMKHGMNKTDDRTLITDSCAPLQISIDGESSVCVRAGSIRQLISLFLTEDGFKKTINSVNG